MVLLRRGPQNIRFSNQFILVLVSTVEEMQILVVILPRHVYLKPSTVSTQVLAIFLLQLAPNPAFLFQFSCLLIRFRTWGCNKN